MVHVGGMLQSHFCAWDRSKEVTVNAEKRRPAFSHAKWAKQRVGLRVGDEGKAYWRMRKNNRFRGTELLEKEEECIARCQMEK